jgi:hypothetical protein
MSQIYTDPSRADDPHALPNAEVFHLSDDEALAMECEGAPLTEGWYWWPCFPGCLPDGEPNGPFDTEADAEYDAIL